MKREGEKVDRPYDQKEESQIRRKSTRRRVKAQEHGHKHTLTQQTQNSEDRDLQNIKHIKRENKVKQHTIHRQIHVHRHSSAI